MSARLAEATGHARRRTCKVSIVGSGWRGRRGCRGLPAATLGLCDHHKCVRGPDSRRRARYRIASAIFLRVMFLVEKEMLLLSATYRKGTP